MDKRLDMILYGATGLTGKCTIPEMAKFSKSEGRSLTWGIAGRSKEKLEQVLKEVATTTDLSLSKIPIIIADSFDEESLKNMARQAKVIISTAGPFALYGEAVIKACIEAGTHYVDVTGEPEFMLEMQLKYHELAKERKVFIVSGCAMESIPADLGIVFLEDHIKGTLNSVDIFFSRCIENVSGPVVNIGTWNSLIDSFGRLRGLANVKRKVFPSPLPKVKPSVNFRFPLFHSSVAKGWAIPFPGPDETVVERSQRYFYQKERKRPVQFRFYAAFKSLPLLILMGIFLAFDFLLAQFKFGRQLLLKYPRLFSAGYVSTEPPSIEAQNNTKVAFTFYAEGWSNKVVGEVSDTPPDTKVTLRISTRNPGYGFTTTAVALSAIMILTERENLPQEGGVLTPAAVFGKTSLLEELRKNGTKIEIIPNNVL